jgi:hypothetical protein
MAQQSLTLVIEECNKYDLTVVLCSSLDNHNDWFWWFAISSLLAICSPNFSFMGEIGKSKYLTWI